MPADVFSRARGSMAFGKFEFPLHGVLLLGMGAILSNIFASAQQLRVAMPLAHASLGCPYLQGWLADADCKRLYRAVDDNGWFAADGSALAMSYATGQFACCRKADYKTSCTKWHGMNADLGTCVLADNYCPTLSIVVADTVDCVGNYYQSRNNTWLNDGNERLAVRVAGRSHSELSFECYNKQTGFRVAGVKKFKCHNPFLSEGLKYGLNKVKDDWIYVVGHRGPSKMSEGGFFRSFEVTTTTFSSDDKIWVWPLVSSWTSDQTVVIAKMFNDDKEAAAVELSDVQVATFKLRLPHASCTRKHGRERVNILQLRLGSHRGLYEEQSALVHRADVTGKSKTLTYHPEGKQFVQLPVVLTQVQKVHNGPADGYMTSRVMARGLSDFTVRLQQLGGKSAPHHSASVGWIAVYSIHSPSFFGGNAVYIHGNSSMTTKLNDENHLERFEPHFARTPHVFVESQSHADEGSFTERLVSSSAYHAEFKLVESTCNAAKSNEHRKETYGVVAVGDATRSTPSPTECVLILESNMPGIFVYSYKKQSKSPVYQKVKEDGTYDPFFFAVVRGWRKTKKWAYTRGRPGGRGVLEGEVLSPNIHCPNDGYSFFSVYHHPTRLVKTGRLFRASSPSWSMCKPTLGRVAGPKASERLTKTGSLTECARLVKGMHPDAAGAGWESTSNQCTAVWGWGLSVSSSRNAGESACVFQCHLLPGIMKSYFGRRSLGIRNTAWECFDLVWRNAPDAIGMSYNALGTGPVFADRGECHAEYEGLLLHDSLDERFRFCPVGGMLNGPGNRAATPTTTTPKPTTTGTVAAPDALATRAAAATQSTMTAAGKAWNTRTVAIAGASVGGAVLLVVAIGAAARNKGQTAQECDDAAGEDEEEGEEDEGEEAYDEEQEW